ARALARGPAQRRVPLDRQLEALERGIAVVRPPAAVRRRPAGREQRGGAERLELDRVRSCCRGGVHEGEGPLEAGVVVGADLRDQEARRPSADGAVTKADAAHPPPLPSSPQPALRRAPRRAPSRRSVRPPPPSRGSTAATAPRRRTPRPTVAPRVRSRAAGGSTAAGGPGCSAPARRCPARAALRTPGGARRREPAPDRDGRPCACGGRARPTAPQGRWRGPRRTRRPLPVAGG